VFFLAIRALNPEIQWGEKPMDFAFLNTLLRAETLPPPEPWLAGAPLSYTYFGHYALAAVGKLLGIHAGVLFNLGIASTAALTAASVLAAGAALGGRLRTGGLAVLLAVFWAPTSGVREAIHRHAAGQALDWHYWWATTRVIAPNAINEYPLWSFLFADLHAHVLAMPFAAGFVALLLFFVTRPRDGERGAAATALLLGLFFAALQITNGWALPVYGVLLVFLPLAVFVATPPRSAGDFLAGLAREVVVPAGAAALVAWVLVRPFWAGFTPPPRNFGREVGPWATPWDFANVWAFFLALLVPFLFVALRRGDPPPGRATRFAIALAAVALPLSLLSVGLHPPRLDQAPSAGFFTGIAALVGLAASLRRGTPARWRPAVILTTFGLLVLTGCEIVFVWDRMNTVFKFHLETWFLFALAGAVALEALVSAGGAAWRAAVALTGAAATLHGGDGRAHVPAERPRELAARDAGRDCLPRVVCARRRGGVRVDQHARPRDPCHPRGAGALVPGLLALRDEHGPADRAGLGVPHAAARPQSGGDRAAGRRRPRRVHVARRGGRSGDPPALPRRARRRRSARAPDVRGREPRALRRVDGPPFTRSTGTPRSRSSPSRAFTRPAGRRRSSASRSCRPRRPARPRPPAPAQQAGQVRQPRGLAADAQGRIWVADFGNNRIQGSPRLSRRSSRSGRRGRPPAPSRTRAALPWDRTASCTSRTPGTGACRSSARTGRGSASSEATSSGRAGSPSTRLAASSSRTRATTGSCGSTPPGRSRPSGAKPTGRAGSPGRTASRSRPAEGSGSRTTTTGRAVLFTPDGAFVRAFDVVGWRRETFSEPYLAVDAKGVVWCSVPLLGEVRGYAPDGTLLATARGKDQPEGKRFEKPSGLALLPGGRLAVADLEGRVVVITLPR
jgi:hypothetical protein